MHIPLTVTANDRDEHVYARIDNEINDIITMIKEVRLRLQEEETFENLDPQLENEIKNLDLEHVSVELEYNKNGNLWLHLWNKSE